MKGHLITCLSMEDLRRFESEGYVGLGPFFPAPDSTRSQVAAKLRILWDVIADLKRVQPGDVCFLHAEGRVFGPYVFRTVFLESAALPLILTSPKLRLDYWWEHRQEFDNLQVAPYGYVAAIDRVSGCNRTGADLMELFLRQSQGLFNGIPPRFMYGDTKKIVKPLLPHEIPQLLEILNFENGWEITAHSTFATDRLRGISLDLTDYGGHVFCEKIIEAWFMEQMALASDQRQAIVQQIGEFNYFSNSIYTYYTNFLDVIAFDADDRTGLSFCRQCNGVIRDFAANIRIIELKRDKLSDRLRTIQQLKAYMNWARRVLNPTTQIFGYIVAAGFDHNYVDLARAGGERSINFLRYEIRGGTLVLQQLR